MWYFEDDNTQPVITAEKQMREHRAMDTECVLSDTAVLLYMSGLEYIEEEYGLEVMIPRFPRFLNSCPVYKLKDDNRLCIMDGGRGAPQAADTIETAKACHVKNIISIGMIGGFSPKLLKGDIVIPPLAYCEEGTSHHYYKEIESAKPDPWLFDQAIEFMPDAKRVPIVSSDAIYRQTYYKEALWREKGAAGVDMETSALFSVGNYIGVKIVSFLMVSDVHPLKQGKTEWKWKITDAQRRDFIRRGIAFALSIS